MPATTGMKGAGYYDRHSTAQLSTIQALQGWVAEAVAGLPLPAAARPVTVLDLGSSEGGNAIRLQAAVVARLRQRTGQPIQTLFSDLPSNNFNRLFANVAEARRNGLLDAEVYPGAVAGSFYGPLLPAGTVHLATSFNAINWLDQLPGVPISDFVVYRRPQPPRSGLVVSAETEAAFRGQAEQDLVRFLESRARELVTGGKLLVATPGDGDGVRVVDGLYDVLNDSCHDLIAAGRLERERYEGLTIPCYFRTVAELVAPLQREDSPVRGLFAVDRAEALEVPPPFIVEFQRGGDVTAFAEAYTGFLRAFSEPVVRAALEKPGGESGIVDALYDRIQSRLLAEPKRYLWRYLLVAALLTRR